MAMENNGAIHLRISAPQIEMAEQLVPIMPCTFPDDTGSR
jgi:hypothetical protein